MYFIFLFFRNCDDVLTFQQAYNYITKTMDLWEHVMLFRIKFISKLFPYGHIYTILDRKANIEEILKYQKYHKNKFPSPSCQMSFMRIVHHTPPIYRYDYVSINSEVVFNDLITMFIQNYNSQFSTQRDILKPKYLSSFKNYSLIGRIDEYYSLFKEKFRIERVSRGSSKRKGSYQSNSKEASLSRKNSISILRPLNQLKYTRNLTTVPSIGTAGFNIFKPNKIVPIKRSISYANNDKQEVFNLTGKCFSERAFSENCDGFGDITQFDRDRIKMELANLIKVQ